MPSFFLAFDPFGLVNLFCTVKKPQQFSSKFFSAACLFVCELRSKSLSDIPMVYPVRKVTNGSLYGKDKSIGSASEWNQDKRCSVAAKDSEAQWQDVSLSFLF